MLAAPARASIATRLVIFMVFSLVMLPKRALPGRDAPDSSGGAGRGREAPLHLVEHHGSDDHEALDDHLPELADAHHDEPVAEDADNESADDGAADGAAPARQRGAAEHRGGDGAELEGFPVCRMRGDK